MDRDKPPILIVHGFKGANLVKGEHRRSMFLTLPMVLNPFCSPNISLPLRWREENGLHVQESDDIEASGPFDLFGKVYPPLVKKLEGEYNETCQVVTTADEIVDGSKSKLFFFVYDWRRDPNESAKKLHSVLNKISWVLGMPPQIIGHSMGAQLAWHVVNKEPGLAGERGR